jgi:hypothetical protein
VDTHEHSPALQPAADAISAKRLQHHGRPPARQHHPAPGYGYAIASLTAKAFDQDSANTGLHIADSSGDMVANGRPA